MAIQDDNTILMKSDLKAYHEAIAPMLGGSFMLSTNVSDYYSTNEKIIGVWTDGKPLYQKTVNFGTLPNNTKKAVAHGISNIEKVISIDGSAYGTTGGIFYAFTFPNVGTNNQYAYDIAIDITGANIDITTQTDRTFLTGIVTIKYTKTTDAANSAVTTPGAYDINFPNTWPENKEIYFGNGLYGFRYVPGSIISCPNKEQTETYPLTNLPLTARFKSMGGCLGIDENNILEFPWNYVDASISTSISAQCGGFYFSKDSNNKYRLTFYERNDTGGTQTLRNIDVWVTYTK
jgi:hypothetical protein